jgi:hypothetical protein
MAADSALDADALAKARELLAAPPKSRGTGAALAAAAFVAMTAMALAVTVILMPLMAPVEPRALDAAQS